MSIVGVVLAGASAGGAVALAHTARGRASTASTASQQLSRRAIPESQTWRGYDEAPASALVRPIRVLQVTGNVTNPQALGHPGSGGATTLSFTIGGDAAVAGAGLRQGRWSPETRSRTETFSATRSGVVTGALIQGAERYQRVTLTSAGSVALRSAAIRFAALRKTPSVMRGHFLSSDRLLNRIWHAGAYTLNLNQMTPGTTVAPGAVNQRHLILDGDKRDRAVWSGDHLISDLTDYYVSNPVYARESLALLLEHPATTASQLGKATGTMSRAGPLPVVCSPTRTTASASRGPRATR